MEEGEAARGSLLGLLDLLKRNEMRNIHELSIRNCGDNPRHHLWNNNGIWWVHFTISPTPQTTQRVRRSLRTKVLSEAQRRRDRFLQLSGQLIGVRQGSLGSN